MPQTWTWATGITSCDSAPVWNTYSELTEMIRPEHVAFCQGYAAKAMAAVSENQSLRCGNSGGSWHADPALHVSWCMGFNGGRAQPDEQTTLRTQAIEQCRGRQVATPLEEARRSPSRSPVSDVGRLAAGSRLGEATTDLARPSPLGGTQGQSPAALIAAPNPGPGVDFSGDWDTASGQIQYRMSLVQDASGRVSGEYSEPNSADRYVIANGAVVGSELIAQWTEGSSTGLARFQLSRQGDSFSGAWVGGARLPDQSGNPWTGTRVVTDPPPDTIADLPAARLNRRWRMCAGHREAAHWCRFTIRKQTS